MRIETTRVPQTHESQRVNAKEDNRPVRSTSHLEETTDRLALSSAVRVAKQRDIEVSQLREAYRNGALRPDAERIAERMMRWGFDLTGEEAL